MSRSSQPARAGLLLAATLTTALACTWFESVDDDGADEQDAQNRDAIELAEQVDYKLRQYSACRDTMAWLVGQTWLRYVDQVDDDGQPRRKREGVYLRGIGSNAFRGCRRILASAPRTRPDMPKLQAHAEAAVAAAEAFAALTRDLAHALGDENRDDDDWSALSKIDPQLRQHYATWKTADTLLEDALDARHLDNDPLLLGALEGRRSPLEVASRALMIEARPIARCLAREPAPSSADCQPTFDEFDRAYARFAAAHREDAQADKVFWMSTFAIDAQEFHAEVAEQQQRLGQRKGRERDVQDMVDAYAALVRDAETLDFDFP